MRTASSDRETTRARLLDAAASVFAARGYRGATMREIALRARANLAAAHYHFGSKQDLYLEVARSYFEEMEERLTAAGVDAHAPPPDRSRAELERALGLRIETMLELLVEDSGGHARIMQRELADPGDALPEIVRRFVEPMRSDLDALVSRLEPDLPRDEVERCTRSIAGQIWFYATHRAALLRMMGRESYPRGFARVTAAHITRFSLAGITAAATAERRTA